MSPTTSASALEQLQGFQSSRRKPQDILKESQTRLGIPTAQQRAVGLRSAIGNTENLIRNVDPSVTGRTSGSLVTEAQRNRLVSLERQPLDETFRTQSQALQGEESNLNTLERNALQEAQLATSADDQRANELQGIYSILYQREADERARQEREAEVRRQAQAQAAYLRSLAPSAPIQNTNLTTTGSPDPQKDPRERAARIISGDIRTQASSYQGLTKAAAMGDPVAVQTLSVLDQLRPGLKTSYKKILASDVGQPTPQNLPGQQGQLLKATLTSNPVKSNIKTGIQAGQGLFNAIKRFF